MSRRSSAVLFFALVAGLGSLAHAQTPDGRGEVALSQPSYQGVHADAPIPGSQHVRNEGGSDGAGLCVISSIVAAGQYQGVPGLSTPGPGTSNEPGNSGQVSDAPGKGSALWRTAKSRPGGYGPEKLERLLGEVMPGEKYVSYTGLDAQVLEDWSQQGYAIGVTMNTGKLYGYRPIHHMVTLTYFRLGGWACVVDNNDPGRFHWMPADEFLRRWVDGVGWAFTWLWKSLDRDFQVDILAGLITSATTSLLVFFCLLIARRRWRRVHVDPMDDPCVDPWWPGAVKSFVVIAALGLSVAPARADGPQAQPAYAVVQEIGQRPGMLLGYELRHYRDGNTWFTGSFLDTQTGETVDIFARPRAWTKVKPLILPSEGTTVGKDLSLNMGVNIEELQSNASTGTYRTNDPSFVASTSVGQCPQPAPAPAVTSDFQPLVICALIAVGLIVAIVAGFLGCYIARRAR